MEAKKDDRLKAERQASIGKAVSAYMRCEHLSVEERRRLVKAAGVKMTLLKALRVTINFALGYIKNPWSFASIRRLTQAWLKLGEKWFRRIYRWVKPKTKKDESFPCIDPASVLA